MLRSKESTTRRAIDGGEKLGTSRSRGMRNGTRGAIMRRDLSGTLERGMSRKEKKKKRSSVCRGRKSGTTIGLKRAYASRFGNIEHRRPHGKTMENWSTRKPVDELAI